ncbi:hypothetical protein OHB24_21450 [Kribbella sp. NBC_00482]|uniref:hypothetical protein n=1 Tax=Kribbella sp. NBC_00482 TaxID=2975968 RepID=UPI002E173841
MGIVTTMIAPSELLVTAVDFLIGGLWLLLGVAFGRADTQSINPAALVASAGQLALRGALRCDGRHPDGLEPWLNRDHFTTTK